MGSSLFSIRPAPSEYAEYYGGYIGHVPDGDVLSGLARQGEATRRLLMGVGESLVSHRYAPDKWSIKQVVGHLVDGEWLFGYRALAFARRDPAALPSMDQDAWMRAAEFDRRPVADLIDALWAVRQATLSIFSGFDAATMACTGVASGNQFTVRSLVWITAGHELHHLRILGERYGVAPPAL